MSLSARLFEPVAEGAERLCIVMIVAVPPKRDSIYLLWGRLWCEAGHLLLCGNCGTVRHQTSVKEIVDYGTMYGKTSQETQDCRITQ